MKFVSYIKKERKKEKNGIPDATAIWIFQSSFHSTDQSIFHVKLAINLL